MTIKTLILPLDQNGRGDELQFLNAVTEATISLDALLDDGHDIMSETEIRNSLGWTCVVYVLYRHNEAELQELIETHRDVMSRMAEGWSSNDD